MKMEYNANMCVCGYGETQVCLCMMSIIVDCLLEGSREYSTSVEQ